MESNRANWNDRVAVHAQSQFYDVNSWLRDAPGPRPMEVEALGDVTGKTLVHLQCHFGMDTLQWARAGARVTGVDFSPPAIEEAKLLAERAGLSSNATFVYSDVYDAVEALHHERFDIVYVSLGALCWLPDIDKWGEIVSELLAPGGTFYIHDVHPFTMCLDDDGTAITYSYFEESDNPLVSDYDTTYTDGATLKHTVTYEWNHSVAEIAMSLIRRGLVLDSLAEHDWTVFRQFNWLVEIAPGHFVVPESHPRVPLTFTLLAHAAMP